MNMGLAKTNINIV